MKFLMIVYLVTLLLATTLSGIEISKASGDARFYYGTADDHDMDLFSQGNATGQFALAGDAALSFNDSVKANFGATFLSTLGLENSMITYIFAGGTTKDQLWLDEVNLDVKFLEKTNTTLGRQYLSSPMLYSIDWNIVSNAMDGFYITDEHLPQTKVMGFWIGREWSNDYNATSDELNFSGNFRTFGEKGAFGVGIETQLIPTVTAEVYLGAYLTNTTNSTVDVDTTDLTLSANTSFGMLNTMLVYIYIQRDDYNEAEGYNTLQGYLTYAF